MGQEPYSCDTTQIDVLETSARFTRHHACPMDNGWVPVGIYLGRPVQAALESPFTRPRPALIPPPKALCWITLSGFAVLELSRPPLRGKVCCTDYYSFSQVCLLFGCWSHYSRSFFVCQPPFFNSLKKIFPGPAFGGPRFLSYHKAEYPYLSTTASNSCFSLHMGHSSGR